MTHPGLNEAVETAGVGVERYLPNRDTRSATGRKRREKRPGKRHGSESGALYVKPRERAKLKWKRYKRQSGGSCPYVSGQTVEVGGIVERKRYYESFFCNLGRNSQKCSFPFQCGRGGEFPKWRWQARDSKWRRRAKDRKNESE